MDKPILSDEEEIELLEKGWVLFVANRPSTENLSKEEWKGMVFAFQLGWFMRRALIDKINILTDIIPLPIPERKESVSSDN